MDELDRKILRVLQRDASLPLEQIAKSVNSSRSPVWNRIRKLKADGVIRSHVAVLNPESLGLTEVFFVAIKTDQHNAEWARDFATAIDEMPEILEAHRMAGEIDYLLKVRVASTRAFDEFYKRLIARIPLYNVTSSLSMEQMKETLALPIE